MTEVIQVEAVVVVGVVSQEYHSSITGDNDIGTI